MSSQIVLGWFNKFLNAQDLVPQPPIGVLHGGPLMSTAVIHPRIEAACSTSLSRISGWLINAFLKAVMCLIVLVFYF